MLFKVDEDFRDKYFKYDRHILPCGSDVDKYRILDAGRELFRFRWKKCIEILQSMDIWKIAQFPSIITELVKEQALFVYLVSREPRGVLVISVLARVYDLSDEVVVCVIKGLLEDQIIKGYLDLLNGCLFNI